MKWFWPWKIKFGVSHQGVIPKLCIIFEKTQK